MPADDKQIPGRLRTEESIDIDGLLARIEGEKVPEHLLLLAKELQDALSLRKTQWPLQDEP